MTGALLIFATIALPLALCGVIVYDLAPLFGYDSRAPLPRHAGQARPAIPAAAPEAGPPAPPAGPAGSGPEMRDSGPLPLAVETPALYNTGAMPVLSEHTERWWLL